MRPRAFAGLLLCAFLLGSTWPTLAALPGIPSQIVAGDAYVIAQGTGNLSINTSLAENLTTRSGATVVSPEIFGLGTLAAEPVVVRAADPSAFFLLERVTGVTLPNETLPFAFLGQGLADRLGLSPGDTVTAVGSYAPRIAFLRITGVYRTSTPANDELVVDEGMGRFLTLLTPPYFHAIRVRTVDPAALLGFLEGFGASVHVSGPGRARADVHSDPPSDERLVNLILRTGQGGSSRDYFATAIGEATSSVRVVAYGVAGVLGLLVALGIHAVQARAFADRVPAVGILRAVGAGNGWMRRRLLVESIPFALLAGVIGVISGFFFGRLLQPNVSLILFGHQVPVSSDPLALAAIILAVVGISIGSSLVLLGSALRVRPVEAIRETPAVQPPESLEVVLRG
jgi:ABC-type lipoprotein release transport system permease subunit